MLCVPIRIASSNEYTQYITFNYIKKKEKHPKNYPKIYSCDFFQGAQEHIRNSRGKRATKVRATECVLLLLVTSF